jgi:hypothetical protein
MSIPFSRDPFTFRGETRNVNGSRLNDLATTVDNPMHTNDYTGKDTLPPELDQRVRSELAADERLVWVGRPRWNLYRGSTIIMSIIGTVFGALALVIFSIGFAGLGAAVGGRAGGLDGCASLLFCLYTPLFMLIGGHLMTGPFWMPKRIRRTVYALTDRRAILWEPGWFAGQYTVRNYTREGLARIHRKDRADGAGDLLFEEFYTRSSFEKFLIRTIGDENVSNTRILRGFICVDRVREVEELLRLTLLV